MRPILERHAASGFFANAYILIGADIKSAADFFARYGAVEIYSDGTIDIARALKERASLAFGGKKQFYILDADAMNWQSYPALLKIIEEPPPGHHFVLHAVSAESVPDTIRSRAIAVALNAQEPANALVQEFQSQSGPARAKWIEACAEDPARFEMFLSECEQAIRARPNALLLLRRIQDVRSSERVLNVGRKMCLEYIIAFL